MHKNINLIKIKFIFIINLYFLPFGLAFKWHQRLVNKVLLEGRSEGIVLLSFGGGVGSSRHQMPEAMAAEYAHAIAQLPKLDFVVRQFTFDTVHQRLFAAAKDGHHHHHRGNVHAISGFFNQRGLLGW
jgi:hypothetical protein